MDSYPHRPRGAEVKAWTGRKMGLALAKRLGPVATWRVMQALGEMRMTPASYGSRVAGVSTFSRAQFLKGLSGVTVAMPLLSGTVVFPAVAASREGWLASRDTTAQRRAIEGMVRSSEQYRSATRRAGKALDFGRAEFWVNGAVGAAAVVVPTMLQRVL